jgi:curli production assembly/transport component CsgE
MHIAWGAPSAALAQDSERTEVDTLKEAYGGIVLNQTITVGGQEFYRYFVALWRDKPMTEQYAISIHERPSARFGSQVWVEYAQRRMFQAALPSARTAIAPLSERAVETAYQAVVDINVQRMLFQGDDLGRDEI